SLVEDIIMPPIGMALGKVNFSDLFIPLSGNPLSVADAKAKGLPTVNYGNFINILIQFLIIAFVIFLIVKAINRMRRRPEELPPTMKACSYCFSDIAVQATRCPRCTSQLTA
ncbi:MAG TPA: MscL family protein, partial [Blastocatellia bacterium]|nr:MscL family protein [Blastocatellia bacterium]